MDRDFAGRIVVVTGCSAGIGRATALEFARRGADLGLISRNVARLESLRQEIEGLGSRALVLPLDVADAAAIERAAAAVEQELGPIDIWVNNVMNSVFARVHETTPEEFARVTEVTYLSTVYGTLSALRRMRPRNAGTLVQVGSALAYRGIPLQAAYCAAKHAMAGFHDSLRSELLQEKSAVRVTMVQLPAHNTPQFDWVLSRLPRRGMPVPPIYQPEVAARSIAWAAKHPRQREVVVGWPAAKAIWLNKLVPGLADRYLAKHGFESQQVEDQPEDPNRPHNLWESVDGDIGAHGRFDELARDSISPFWLTTYLPPVIVFAGIGLLLIAIVAWLVALL